MRIVFFVLLYLSLNNELVAQYSLPSARFPISENSDTIQTIDSNFTVKGYPIVPTFIQMVTLDGKKVLFLPILMNDDGLPIKISTKLIDPLKLEDEGISFGRKSIWFMDIGSTMLYAILLDMQENRQFGVGFLYITRLSSDKYDLILKDEIDQILFAVRVHKNILNPEIGESELKIFGDQSLVYQEYNFLWSDMNPENFVMVTR